MAFSAKYIFALVAIVFVQGSSAGYVKRSAEVTTTPFQDLLENAKAHLQSMNEEFNKFVNSNNLDEVKTLLESKTKELEERAKNVLEELKRQYDTHGAELSEKVSAALTEASQRINATLEDLKSQTPGVMDEATALHQKFTEAFKNTAETIFEETGKLAKAAGEDASSVHTSLTDLSRAAVSQTVEVMQQFHNEVQNAVKKATA